MKKVIKKDKSEKIRLGDFLDSYYYHCEKCEMAFFKDDIVIRFGLNILCPLCKSDMHGGDERHFNYYYELDDEANKKLVNDKPIPNHKPIHFDNS